MGGWMWRIEIGLFKTLETKVDEHAVKLKIVK